MASNMICATSGCGKKLRARGFCVACYYRKLRNGLIESGSQTRKWKHRLRKINGADRTAVCAKCGKVRINRRGKNQWRCSTDVAVRSRLYKQAYLAEKRSMLKASCEICRSEKHLRWDHCHKTGKFRGTLCNPCNSGIGFFRDNSKRLRSAAAYLERKS